MGSEHLFACTQEGFLAEDDAGAHDAYERERDEEADIKAVSAAAAAQHRADEAACMATTPDLAKGILFVIQAPVVKACMHALRA